jgi:hypothetical protein
MGLFISWVVKPMGVVPESDFAGSMKLSYYAVKTETVSYEWVWAKCLSI